MMLPPRSISFSGPPANRLANTIEPSPTLPAELPSNQFVFSVNSSGRQVTGNKSTKKGIKNRLRRFRRKQGPSSRDVSAYITSGESDSEAAFDLEPDSIFNTGGIAHMFAPSVGGSSRSSTFTRPKLPHNDSSLPPQLPPRNNYIGSTSNNISNASSGQGKGWLSGSEHGNETQKESSSVRLKGLLKSVGLSNQHSAWQAPIAPPTPDQLRPSQPRSTFPLFGDFLSGDDQPASKVFSLKRPERRKKRWTKKSRSAAAGVHAAPTVATDDEDSSASRSGRHNHHNHHHQHRFLHHWHPRHRSRSIDVGGSHDPIVTHKQEPIFSAALREARQGNHDPNVLIVELEPLPPNFKDAFAALSPSKASQQQQRHQQHSPQPQPYAPLASYISPSSTVGPALASVYCGPIGTLTNYQNIPTPQRSPAAKCSSTIGTKTFLFKSYENLKFQGHYIFRVVGDNIEYKKLPLTLEQPCSQYFREAWVTYRSLEKKAKTLREELERRRINHFWARNLDFENRIDQSAPLSVTIPKPIRDYSQKNSELERRSSEDTILKSAVAWDQLKSTGSVGPTESPVSTPTLPISKAGYLDQRYSPQTGTNSVLRGIIGGADRSKSDPIGKSTATELYDSSSRNGSISFQATPRSALYHSRRRSWSSIKEQQHSEQQKQQAIEEATWREMERKHREEFQQATYGLELFLTELVKGSEYEIFDAAADVAILNENRGNAVFSIINSDRTNVMCLESPSVKLKYEFLNWIAVSTMDYGEVEDELIPAPQTKLPKNSSLDFLTANMDGHEEKSELDEMNETAKETMTNITRDIDSQEVQLALRPSPTTGMTLAATVEKKINEVQERIRVCSTIMDEARHNLYRLRYEIELEQRSIRLFRQYKIIIAVVTISIVFMVWFLYHSRANPLGPQPPSPLFPAPANPIEVDYRFRRGGLSVSTPSISIPTIFTHESANIVEYEPEPNHNHVDFGTMDEIDIEDKEEEPGEKAYEAKVANDILSEEKLDNPVKTQESSQDEVFEQRTHGNSEDCSEQPHDDKSLPPLEPEREAEECVVDSDLSQIPRELEPATAQKYCIVHS
ncbi:hypothetical protein BGX26_011957 [Mortierella sp. AD094]|nr:hypothetical protein BGX26_011957 [Mortierella sp. AD094]